MRSGGLSSRTSYLGDQKAISFGYVRIKIPARFGSVTVQGVSTFDFAILYIWWVPDDYIEATTVHDAVEVDEPVERLMTRQPLVIATLVLAFLRDVVGVDAVLSRQCPVQFLL